MADFHFPLVTPGCRLARQCALVLLTAALATGCGPAESPPDATQGAPRAVAGRPATVSPSTASEGAAVLAAGITLPGSFAGVLPCADCGGIDTMLTLDADYRYRLRSRYLGKPAGEDTFVEAGRFAISDAGTRLALYGPADDLVIFAIQGPEQLTRLDASGQPITSQLNYTLTRAPETDAILEPARTLGLFTYLADAATFVDCHTGQQLPVAMGGDFPALQKAYAAAQAAPGSGQLVRLQAHVALAVGMEEALGAQPTLVVDKFEELIPGEAQCRRPRAPLEGTRWLLTRLGAVEVPTDAAAIPDLLLDPGGERLGGSTGCNTMSGGYDYSVASGALTFGPIATTRKACPAGIVDETTYTQALQRATQASVTGESLVLSDGESELASFRAEPAGARQLQPAGGA